MKKTIYLISFLFLLTNCETTGTPGAKFRGWHFAEFQRCINQNSDFEGIYSCGVNNSDSSKYGYDSFITYVDIIRGAVKSGEMSNSTAKLNLLEHCQTTGSKIVTMGMYGW